MPMSRSGLVCGGLSLDCPVFAVVAFRSLAGSLIVNVGFMLK